MHACVPPGGPGGSGGLAAVEESHSATTALDHGSETRVLGAGKKNISCRPHPGTIAFHWSGVLPESDICPGIRVDAKQQRCGRPPSPQEAIQCRMPMGSLRDSCMTYRISDIAPAKCRALAASGPGTARKGRDPNNLPDRAAQERSSWLIQHAGQRHPTLGWQFVRGQMVRGVCPMKQQAEWDDRAPRPLCSAGTRRGVVVQP